MAFHFGEQRLPDWARGEAFLVNMQEERVQPARVFDVRLLSFLIT